MFAYAYTVIGSIILVLPAKMHAQIGIITNNLPGCNFQTGSLTPVCIPVFVAHLIQLIFMFTGIFFILNLMYAGYQMAIGAATGDKEKGKNRLLWSLIGFAVCALSLVILDTIVSVIAG